MSLSRNRFPRSVDFGLRLGFINDSYGFSAAAFAPAIAGILFRPGEWYRQLNKPSWRPPDWLFVTDIPYIRTCEGFAYLAVVIDLFSRRVIGWALQRRQTTDVVLQALLMAV
ncbi:DDE-type integrase/transposase/recombinase, partial [Mycoplana ramosa]